MPDVAIIVPGAVTAGNNIAIPDYFKPAAKIYEVVAIALAEGTPNTFSTTTPTVTYVDSRHFTLGADTDASTLLVVVYESAIVQE